MHACGRKLIGLMSDFLWVAINFSLGRLHNIVHNTHCIGKFDMAALDYPGPYCKEIGILTDALLSDVNALPAVETKNFNKGAALELSDFRRNNDIPWEDFHSWIEHLCAQADNSPTLQTIQVKLTRLESKFKELRRNKRQDLLTKLKNEPFFESFVVK